MGLAGDTYCHIMIPCVRERYAQSPSQGTTQSPARWLADVEAVDLLDVRAHGRRLILRTLMRVRGSSND
jgi:hypothetical protein